MFDISWFWLYYILWYHFKNVVFSLYMHRGIGHRMITFSPGFAHFCRFWLWVAGITGPMYVETYYTRHTNHHRYSDTKRDPHSPYFMTIKQLLTPWGYDIDTLSKSPLKTPIDWMQRNVYDPYYQHGKWVSFLIAGILFGPWGFVLALVVNLLTEPWLSILVGNWGLHKIGFTYEKNKHKVVKSRNLFPIGILYSGEELHTNHHNYPNSINYRKRWFEFDIGYIYAVILRALGWADFKEQPINKKRKS